MNDEKPIHVRVAKALGCERQRDWGKGWCCMCHGFPHGRGPFNSGGFSEDTRIPRYDLDWSATGPLVEKYALDLWYVAKSVIHPHATWRATCEHAEGSEEDSTPLLAICNLILALHAAGKLKEAA